jgi:hypothetical protein
VGIKALLGFAPFVAFALIEKLVGIVPGLAAGFLVSLALAAWEAVRHRAFHILEIGSSVIFGSLMLVALLDRPSWSIWQVRLYVDGGLALIVFLGLLLKRPFTLQHGLRSAPADAMRSPDFPRHNTILSMVWGVAFAGLAAIDACMTSVAGASDRIGIVLTVAVLGGAAKFTQGYVKRIRNAVPGA